MSSDKDLKIAALNDEIALLKEHIKSLEEDAAQFRKFRNEVNDRVSKIIEYRRYDMSWCIKYVDDLKSAADHLAKQQLQIRDLVAERLLWEQKVES